MYSTTRVLQTPKQDRAALSVGTLLAREAPSVRIGFFGVHDIEGMAELLLVCSTLTCF